MKTIKDLGEEAAMSVVRAKEALLFEMVGPNPHGVYIVVHPDGTEEYKAKDGGTLMWIGKPEIKYDEETITVSCPVTSPHKFKAHGGST